MNLNRPTVILLTSLLSSGMQTCDLKNGKKDDPSAMDSTSVPRTDAWLLQQSKFEELRLQQVDFTAFGKDGDWQMNLSTDRIITFKSMDSGSSIVTKESEEMLPADMNAIMYAAEMEAGRVLVTVYQDSCEFGNSLEKWPYSVRVLVDAGKDNFQEYRGCGLYLNAPSLHDIWVLSEWNRFDDLKSMFPTGPPRMEFHMEKNEYYGYSGCVEISGRFEPKGSKLDILSYMPGKVACNQEGHMAFIEALSTVQFDLSLDGIYLRLSNEKEVLTFRKVD